MSRLQHRAEAPPPAGIAVWEKPADKGALERLAPAVAGQLGKALPRFLKGQADRLIRCMITEAVKTPRLMECTPASLFGGVVQAGQLGLTIGGPTGEAYLLPFKNSKKGVQEAQLIVGYRGYIALAHRSGHVRRITPRVVRDGDKFCVRMGTWNSIDHAPLRGANRPATDYYVVVELVNGGSDFELFTHDDAVAFRDRCSTVRNAPEFVRNSSPWYDMAPAGGFEQMALKTLIRKLVKRLPLSAEASAAAGLDEQADRDEPQNLGAGLLADLGNPPAFEPGEMAPPAIESPAAGRLFPGDDNLPD